MFLSTNNKCSLTNKSSYALNMKLSGDSLLICGDLRLSAVICSFQADPDWIGLDWISPTRCTRYIDESSFIPIATRSDVYKFSFFPRTVNDWNSAQAEVHLKLSSPSDESLELFDWAMAPQWLRAMPIAGYWTEELKFTHIHVFISYAGIIIFCYFSYVIYYVGIYYVYNT